MAIQTIKVFSTDTTTNTFTADLQSGDVILWAWVGEGHGHSAGIVGLAEHLTIRPALGGEPVSWSVMPAPPDDPWGQWYPYWDYDTVGFNVYDETKSDVYFMFWPITGIAAGSYQLSFTLPNDVSVSKIVSGQILRNVDMSVWPQYTRYLSKIWDNAGDVVLDDFPLTVNQAGADNVGLFCYFTGDGALDGLSFGVSSFYGAAYAQGHCYTDGCGGGVISSLHYVQSLAGSASLTLQSSDILLLSPPDNQGGVTLCYLALAGLTSGAVGCTGIEYSEPVVVVGSDRDRALTLSLWMAEQSEGMHSLILVRVAFQAREGSGVARVWAGESDVLRYGVRLTASDSWQGSEIWAIELGALAPSELGHLRSVVVEFDDTMAASVVAAQMVWGVRPTRWLAGASSRSRTSEAFGVRVSGGHGDFAHFDMLSVAYIGDVSVHSGTFVGHDVDFYRLASVDVLSSVPPVMRAVGGHVDNSLYGKIHYESFPVVNARTWAMSLVSLAPCDMDGETLNGLAPLEVSDLLDDDEPQGEAPIESAPPVAAANDYPVDQLVIGPGVEVWDVSNRFLLVRVCLRAGGVGNAVSSVTRGAQSGFRIGRVVDDSGVQAVEMWGLVAPAVGSDAIEIAFNGVVMAVVASAQFFWNVHQEYIPLFLGRSGVGAYHALAFVGDSRFQVADAIALGNAEIVFSDASIANGGSRVGPDFDHAAPSGVNTSYLPLMRGAGGRFAGAASGVAAYVSWGERVWALGLVALAPSHFVLADIPSFVFGRNPDGGVSEGELEEVVNSEPTDEIETPLVSVPADAVDRFLLVRVAFQRGGGSRVASVQRGDSTGYRIGRVAAETPDNIQVVEFWGIVAPDVGDAAVAVRFDGVVPAVVVVAQPFWDVHQGRPTMGVFGRSGAGLAHRLVFEGHPTYRVVDALSVNGVADSADGADSGLGHVVQFNKLAPSGVNGAYLPAMRAVGGALSGARWVGEIVYASAGLDRYWALGAVALAPSSIANEDDLPPIDPGYGGSLEVTPPAIGVTPAPADSLVVPNVVVEDAENRFLLVRVAYQAMAGSRVTGVVRGAQSAYRVGETRDSFGIQVVEMWGMVAPAVGVQDVVVTFDKVAAAIVVVVQALASVNQQHPIAGYVGNALVNGHEHQVRFVGSADLTIFDALSVLRSDDVIDASAVALSHRVSYAQVAPDGGDPLLYPPLMRAVGGLAQGVDAGRLIYQSVQPRAWAMGVVAVAPASLVTVPPFTAPPTEGEEVNPVRPVEVVLSEIRNNWIEWRACVGPLFEQQGSATAWDWTRFYDYGFVEKEGTLAQLLSAQDAQMLVSEQTVLGGLRFAGLGAKGGLWVGPKEKDEGWEYVGYQVHTTVSEAEQFSGLSREGAGLREHSGVHSAGAPVRLWAPLETNDGRLHIIEEGDESLAAFSWRAELSGVRAPRAFLRVGHAVLVQTRHSPTERFSDFLLGWIDNCSIEDDYTGIAKWKISLTSVHGMLKKVEQGALLFGERSIAQHGRVVKQDVPLSFPHKEFWSGDLLSVESDTSAKSALDGDGATVWIGDRVVGSQVIWDFDVWTPPSPGAFGVMTRLFLNPPAGLGDGYRFIEVTAASDPYRLTRHVRLCTKNGVVASLDLNSTNYPGQHIIICENRSKFLALEPCQDASKLVEVGAAPFDAIDLAADAIALRDVRHGNTYAHVWVTAALAWGPAGSDAHYVFYDGDMEGSSTPARLYWSGAPLASSLPGQGIRYSNVDNPTLPRDHYMVDYVTSGGYDYGRGRDTKVYHPWVLFRLPGFNLNLDSDLSAADVGVVRLSNGSSYSTNGLDGVGVLQVGGEQMSYAKLDAECVRVTARGVNGTAATFHQAGSLVYVVDVDGMATDAFAYSALGWDHLTGSAIHPSHFKLWGTASLVQPRTPLEDQENNPMSNFAPDYVQMADVSWHTGDSWRLLLSPSRRLNWLLFECSRVTADPGRVRVGEFTATVDAATCDSSSWRSDAVGLSVVFAQVLTLAGLPAAALVVDGPLVGAQNFRTTTEPKDAWTLLRDLADFTSTCVVVDLMSRITVRSNGVWMHTGRQRPAMAFQWTRENISGVRFMTDADRPVAQVRMRWTKPDGAYGGTMVYPALAPLDGVGRVEALPDMVFADELWAYGAVRRRYMVARYPRSVVVKPVTPAYGVHAAQIHDATWVFEDGALQRYGYVVSVDNMIEKGRWQQAVRFVDLG